jgi:hypothetical protein
MAEDGVVAEFARLLINANINYKHTNDSKSTRSASSANDNSLAADYEQLQLNEFGQQDVQQVEAATPAARRACTVVLAELARYVHRYIVSNLTVST